ncbi:YraN family protein [Candidatus Sumerlaeota bacterium]|nr:YraN family protein [Candidatus Sumerlaeota bacterium]
MRSIIARLFPARGAKENDDIGSWGEEIAVEFLRKKGYRIIERNFRCKRGEIDIVASEGNSLVFVEVKTRSSTQFGEPEQAVNPEKLRHLQHTAYIYLRKNKIKPGGVRFRFDIVSILADWNTRKVVSIKLFKGTH